MAAVQKRKNSYRAQVRRNGKSVSATFDTKREAIDWAAQAETKLLQGSSIERIKSAPADSSAFTGAEMLLRCGREVSNADLKPKILRETLSRWTMQSLSDLRPTYGLRLKIAGQKPT